VRAARAAVTIRPQCELGPVFVGCRGAVASWSLTINLASREVVREICRGEWG
jgi:hypothetical protein